MDAVGKSPDKRVRALGKKNVETVKATVLQGKATTPQEKTAALRRKGGLKRPFDAEVASAQPVKQTKKAMFHPTAIVTAMGMETRASGSKVVASTKKNYGACMEMPHSCYWCYGRGVFDLVTGVIASRSDNSRLDSGNHVDARASRHVSSSLSA
jgi:hypothetical protein